MNEHLTLRDRQPASEDSERVRAAIYARTSTTQQTFGHSLNEQVRLSIERCQTLDWVPTFVFRDEAESGKDTDRPMFQRMLSWAERRAFDVVVFWKLDRFSRSLMHAVQLEARLRKHDVGLYSVTEQIDTTSAAGRFNFRNIASAAEFERDMIQQRTKMGLHALATEQKWPNDNPPLGYEIDDDGRLNIVEIEEKLVKDIFRIYVEEKSMPQVAEWLNQRGISTKGGGEWVPRAVGDILRNKIYRGDYELGDTSKHVPEYRIIDDERFKEVASLRTRFQNSSETRKPMPKSRKERNAWEMYETYRKYLDSCS